MVVGGLCRIDPGVEDGQGLGFAVGRVDVGVGRLDGCLGADMSDGAWVGVSCAVGVSVGGGGGGEGGFLDVPGESGGGTGDGGEGGEEEGVAAGEGDV